MADPQWGAVIKGFAPTTDIVTNPEMLYLALGILGATVMPHNLYLHSGVVQTRRFGESTTDRRKMGELVAPLWVTILAAMTAAIIIALNVKLLWDLAKG